MCFADYFCYLIGLLHILLLWLSRTHGLLSVCQDKNPPARLNATNHFPILFISANIPKHQLAGPDKSLFGGWKSVSWFLFDNY